MKQYGIDFIVLIVETLVKVARDYNLSYELALDIAIDFVKELQEHKDESDSEIH